jgi:RNase P/RNase MRP subunit p30
VDVAVLRAAAPGGRAEASQPLLRPGGSAESGAELVQHTRLTVVADEPAHCARLAAAGDVTRTYDLLAVQPESERAFASACTTLDVDIITFDLARRLPFRLRAPTVRAALARGIVFELCYAPALREPTLRRQLFANALAVVHATGGAGIILSSGALRAFELRGPHDVANLGTLFSLPLGAAKEAVASRMLAVLQHARARRAACVGRQVLPLAAQPEGSAAVEATLAWPARPAAALPPAPAAREDTRDRDADAGFLRL